MRNLPNLSTIPPVVPQVATMPSLVITAHAGCLETRPNSLESLDAAHRAGCPWAEVDVRLAPGGRLVLAHDPEGVSGALSLEAAWDRAAEWGLGLNLDVKEEPVLEVLARFLGQTSGNAVITGCREAWASEVRRLVPWVPVLLNVHEGPAPGEPEARWAQRLVRWCRVAGTAGLNADARVVTPALVDAARGSLVPLFVWTVDEGDEMARLASWGVTGLTTRRPDRAHRILTAL